MEFCKTSKDAGSRGFTLMNAVVALATLSILVLILAQFSASASDIFTTMERINWMTDSFEQLQGTLASNRACSKNFENQNVALSPDSPTDLTMKFYPYDPVKDVLLSIPILEIGNSQTLGKSTRGVNVKKIRLFDKVTLSAATHLAELEVTYELEGRTPQAIVRRLPLAVVLGGGQVKECWLKKGNPKIVYSQVCLGLSNRALDSVDERTGDCVLAGGRWIDGTTSSASCPNGFLPSGASTADNCNVIMPPNFQDTFPKTTVCFPSGCEQTAGRDPYLLQLDVQNKTCHCLWAKDLSASSYAGARCQIYCVVP